MELTNELLNKARAAKTPAELLELAKTENIELTAEDAEKAFVELHKAGEISDEELDNVSGGGCSKGYKSGPTPKFSIGERVKYTKIIRWHFGHNGVPTSECKEVTVTVVDSYKSGDLYIYTLSDGGKETEPKLKKA